MNNRKGDTKWTLGIRYYGATLAKKDKQKQYKII